jgi:hypothetical protein
LYWILLRPPCTGTIRQRFAVRFLCVRFQVRRWPTHVAFSPLRALTTTLRLVSAVMSTRTLPAAVPQVVPG